MRRLLPLLLFFSVTSFAQITFTSHTTEGLRGVSAVSRLVAWASGTHGTYLRMTDGNHWVAAQVPDGTALDFRGVSAFSADEAFLMSSGTGDQSRIYHTSDAGQHWQLQFTVPDPKGFLDSMIFWDPTHGVVVGDPVADETGKLKFEVFLTSDGQNWRAVPASHLPVAMEGEGAFAASNSCIAILTAGSAAKRELSSRRDPFKKATTTKAPEGIHAVAERDRNIWFATGGMVSRVFHSADGGETWQVSDTPIVHGADSTGIFSIAFRDATHGVIAGGDYKHPNEDGANLAFTSDGGKTWTLSSIHPQAFFSAAAYDRASTEERLFIVGTDFVFDFRPPVNPMRISPKKKSGITFNAISAYPAGGGLVVGPKGSIAAVR